MPVHFVETDPSVANTIMGSNFISLEEALSIFPCPKEYLEELGPIPYSPGTLYQCSEPGNQYIIFPGIYRAGKQPLTITAMRNYFPEHKPFFAPWDGIMAMVVANLKHNTVQPCWHLISKSVLHMNEMQKFCVRQDIPYSDLSVENAVTYIYAWLLMKRLRNESVFAGKPFYCADDLAAESYNTALQFNENQIFVKPYIPKNRRFMTELGFVPTIDPDYTLEQ